MLLNYISHKIVKSNKYYENDVFNGMKLYKWVLVLWVYNGSRLPQ